MQVSVSWRLPEEVPVDPQLSSLAPHPVVDLVLQVGDVGKCPKALGFGSLDQFLTASKQGPCFTATEEDGGDQFQVPGSNPEQNGNCTAEIHTRIASAMAD